MIKLWRNYNSVTSYSVGTGKSFPRGKAKHSLLSTAEVKSKWSYISKPPNAVMMYKMTISNLLLQFSNWLQMVFLWVVVSAVNTSRTGQVNLLPWQCKVTKVIIDCDWRFGLSTVGHRTSINKQKGEVHTAVGTYTRNLWLMKHVTVLEEGQRTNDPMIFRLLSRCHPPKALALLRCYAA
jgi:hypothetical protein